MTVTGTADRRISVAPGARGLAVLAIAIVTAGASAAGDPDTQRDASSGARHESRSASAASSPDDRQHQSERRSSGATSDGAGSERRADRIVRRSVGGPSEPVAVAWRPGGGDARSRSVEVRVEDGRVRATVDGVDVSGDLITLRDGLVVITDDEGRLIEEIRVGGPADAARREALLARMAPGGAEWPTAVQSPPRAVLGVHLAETDAALCSQLGLTVGETTLVTHVVDGSAAAEAGLQAHDLIVAIDGRRPTPPSRLRELIAAGEPGTEFGLEIIRGGKPVEMTVTLREFQGPIDAVGIDIRVIDQRVRERLGLADVHLDILNDVDDRLRHWLFVAPGAPPEGVPGEPERNAPGAPRVDGDDDRDREVAELQRSREMLFQVLPESADRLREAAPHISAAMDQRLRAVEARLETLTTQLERLLERLEAPR